MLLILIPFFLLTSAMAAGLAYFSARFVFIETRPRHLQRTRTILLCSAFLFPLVYFGLYMLAQPKDPSDPEVTADIAMIPAIWVGLLLLGAALGLTRAIIARRKIPPPPHP